MKQQKRKRKNKLYKLNSIFNKIHNGKELNYFEVRKFKLAMLLHFADWDCDKGWVQQYHLGALRNNNKRMLHQLGADTGWDFIGDFSQAKALAKFLNRLDEQINWLKLFYTISTLQIMK